MKVVILWPIVLIMRSLSPLFATLNLWRRFWPQLVAVMLVAIPIRDLLMQLAARAALESHMAGLWLLTVVVLTELTMTVAMFQILLPGLPAIRAAKSTKSRPSIIATKGTWAIPSLLSVALLPFFAYYAAWGFLSDIVRQYSRAVLDSASLGQPVGNVLGIVDSRWIIFSVALSWVLRRLAKGAQARSGARPFWQVIVIACDTIWIFIGLYVIGRWKDKFVSWLMNSRIPALLQGGLNEVFSPISQATAAATVVVERPPTTFAPLLINLFFFMLLPVVWLVLTAVVYGYDFREEDELQNTNIWFARISARYQAAPKFLRDFVAHFVSGYRSRYLPVANAVRVALKSGGALVAVLIVGYRLIDWLAAWAWIGATRVSGPHDSATWQIIAQVISLFFGSPYQDASAGLLVEPLRICFLASVLETAVWMTGRNSARPPKSR